jgi:hypothetical protein
LPIWISDETPGLAVRGGRRRAAGDRPPDRLVFVDDGFGDDFGGRRIGFRCVDGLALQAGNA